jgi:2-phospho-L-lactate guanylyltransferase
MRAVIPFKKQNGKSRLSSVLDVREREEFTSAMLADIVETLNSCGVEVDVLSTSMEPLEVDARVIYSPTGLNEALNEYLSKTASHFQPAPSILIVMSDVPLLTPEHLDYIRNRFEDIVIAPGRQGGTNVLYVRNPAVFQVDYYGVSFLDHLQIAEERGLSVHVYDSFYLSCDMDEPGDLIELLIHGRGRAAELLRQWGFYAVRDGVVGLYRD